MTVVLLIMILFTLRLVQIQGFDVDRLAEDADSQSYIRIALPASRGDIVDATGVVLATSLERYSITANQKQIAEYQKTEGSKVTSRGPEGAAEQLSPLLGIDPVELAEKLTGTKGFVYIAKNVTPETWQKIRELSINGIDREQTHVRTYPQGAVAGNVTGFMSTDGKPLAGLELSQDKLLSGEDGYRSYERGLRGQQIPSGDSSRVDAKNGETIQLTIVGDLQWVAQRALDAKVAEVDAEWGAVIVSDIKTGEMLVLADSNSVDPNRFGESENKGSRAVTSIFEPGSTGKVITMSAAIETGIATPTTPYVVDYTYTAPNGELFRDSHEHGRQNLTLAGILAESSNTGTVQVGMNLSKQVRYDYLTKFGLGAKTGIELPGEAKGTLHPFEKWDGRTEYAVLFGQGVAVNAIQANNVFAAVANGGVAAKSHLIKGRTDASGTYHANDVGPGTQVVSRETADQVLKMLEGAVSEGTGNKAEIPGYRVAGKTGTSQIPNSAGALTDNVSSFIGVAPADNPQIAVTVVIYRPTTGYYGGELAAPVFSEVAGHALQYLGIPPSGTTPDLFPTTY